MPRAIPRTGPRGHRYVLTVNSSPHGHIEHMPDSHDLAAGTRVVLMVTPDEGYVFTGWGGHLKGTDNPDAVIMFSNRTVTARFKKI